MKTIIKLILFDKNTLHVVQIKRRVDAAEARHHVLVPEQLAAVVLVMFETQSQTK